MIVLDTDILSALRRSGDTPLRRWLANQSETPCLSIYSVTEIQFGIALVRPRDPGFASVLSAWLEQMVASTEVLAFDVAAARLLGEMQAFERLRPLEGDLVIAATAVAAGCAVATLNQRHFLQIAAHFPELVVIDPLRGG